MFKKTLCDKAFIGFFNIFFNRFRSRIIFSTRRSFNISKNNPHLVSGWLSVAEVHLDSVVVKNINKI